MTVETRTSGQTVERRFMLPVNGGARVHLSRVMSDGVLSTSRIDRLFGPAVGSTVIRAQ
jgi:hypothetical protein